MKVLLAIHSTKARWKFSSEGFTDIVIELSTKLKKERPD